MIRIMKFLLRALKARTRPALETSGRFILLIAMLLNALYITPASPVAALGRPVPVQTYYIPFPEDQLLAGLQAIYPAGPPNGPVNPVTNYVSLAAIAGNTIIYYDQWENGYDPDISNSGNLYSASNPGGTQVWGDGIAVNGAPPGVPSDIINPGTVIILNSTVNTTTPAVIDFDGRDKIAATKNIAMTRSGWAAGTGTILAGAVEVYDTLQWGTLYRAPVGENIPGATDLESFSYTGLAIMAGPGGATVQIDANADSAFETTMTLAEGQGYMVNGSINVGALVSSNRPVQVDILTGRRNATASRDSALLPVSAWSNSYHTPVSTASVAGTSVWLYNPGSSNISVTYTRRVSGVLTSSTLNVPGGTAGGYLKQDLPVSTGASFTSSQNFYAFSTTDTATGSSVTAWDWGFTLIPQELLTPQILVGLGIGRDPTSGTLPLENGNPVWVTPIGNGNTPVTVYVDFDANPATGTATDPNGNHYDVAYSLRELDQQKIFDTTDRNQTGTLVYVLASGVKLAAAWGEDPLVASPGEPGLDVGTVVPPIALFGVGKNGEIAIDTDGNGFVSIGDVIEYTIVTSNVSRTIVSNVNLQDTLQPYFAYVPNSTFNGATPIPDSGSTAFPLDEGGTNIGTLSVGGSITVTFRAQIVSPVTSIQNSGFATAAGFQVAFNNLIYMGGIGDRVWNDINMNGVQDASETGIANVLVRLYSSATNTIVATATTDATGRYTFTGLESGNYFVEFIKPSGYIASPQDQGGNDTLDSDASTANGRTATFAWTAGQTNSTIDAGFWTPTPMIDIQKTPDAQTVNYGQTASFQIVVTNTGNVALNNIVVSDPLAPDCNRSFASLAIGASNTYNCSFANVTANFTNVASVSAVYSSTTVTDSDSADVSLPPDTNAPTADPTQDPLANADGWNNNNVTVYWNWQDDEHGAGIDGSSCTMSSVSSGEGNPVTLSATCRDFAGNTGNASYALKVDKTNPVIVGSRSPAPNVDGWNNTAVAVSFSCTDALSGLAVGNPTGDNTLSGEGAGLSSLGTCYDVAGNSASTTVSDINIDTTKPNTTLTGPSDWTNLDVTLTLNPSDALSGVKATYYILDGGSTQNGTSILITTEGIHSIEYWSVDVAGNEEDHHVAQIKIDKTAPTISHTQAPAANSNGWNNGDVTITFICGDALSGLASCTPEQLVSTEAQAQVITGTAFDNAGNSNTDPATVSIDKTAPIITAAADRDANINNWYDGSVLITFSCSDSLSGIASCTAPQSFGEGSGQAASGTAVDAADNSSSTQYTGINVDMTDPVLNGAATSAPNSYGWYSGDVTVHWTCSDALSGLDGACPADSLISGEGPSLSSSATIYDLAGNSTTTTVSVQIDQTDPVLTVTATVGGNPYTSGTWTNQDVTVSFSCVDDLSGIASSSGPTVVSAEGSGQSVTGTCTDKAGNSVSATFADIQIDKTSPVLNYAVSPAANGAGWNNSDVTVTWSCSDSLSGLNEACASPYIFTGEGMGFLTSASISDLAGNTSTSTVSGINIDRTQPSISVTATKLGDNTPYVAGTWTNQSVLLHFDCTDGGSGIASCPSDITYSTDGVITSTAGTATDNAGNSSNASFGQVKIDKTAPTLSPVVTPSSIPLNGTGTVTANASDALSGVASESCGTLDTSTYGAKTVTCTATDNAGNTGNANANYSVAWNFNGFLQPVDNLPMVNSIKAGQAIPVKFSLGGYQGLAIFATNSPSSQRVTCDSSSPIDLIEQTVTAGSSSLSYDAATDIYTYVWKTDKAWASTCRTLVVTLVDGSTHQAKFNFTR